MWPERFPKSFVPGPACFVLGLGTAVIARVLPAVGSAWAIGLAAVAALLVGAAVGPVYRRARSGGFPGPFADPAGGSPGPFADPAVSGPRFVAGEPYVVWGPAGRQERWRVVYVWGDPERIVLGLRPVIHDGPWRRVRWVRMRQDDRDEAVWRDWQRWRVGIERRR